MTSKVLVNSTAFGLINLLLSNSLSLGVNSLEIMALMPRLISVILASMLVWSCRYFSSPNLLYGLNLLGGTKTVLMKNMVKEFKCRSLPNSTLIRSF